MGKREARRCIVRELTCRFSVQLYGSSKNGPYNGHDRSCGGLISYIVEVGSELMYVQ